MPAPHHVWRAPAEGLVARCLNVLLILGWQNLVGFGGCACVLFAGVAA
jgi:hypothetical protein